MPLERTRRQKRKGSDLSQVDRMVYTKGGGLDDGGGNHPFHLMSTTATGEIEREDAEGGFDDNDENKFNGQQGLFSSWQSGVGNVDGAPTAAPGNRRVVQRGVGLKQQRGSRFVTQVSAPAQLLAGAAPKPLPTKRRRVRQPSTKTDPAALRRGLPAASSFDLAAGGDPTEHTEEQDSLKENAQALSELRSSKGTITMSNAFEKTMEPPQPGTANRLSTQEFIAASQGGALRRKSLDPTASGVAPGATSSRVEVDTIAYLRNNKRSILIFSQDSHVSQDSCGSNRFNSQKDPLFTRRGSRPVNSTKQLVGDTNPPPRKPRKKVGVKGRQVIRKQEPSAVGLSSDDASTPLFFESQVAPQQVGAAAPDDDNRCPTEDNPTVAESAGSVNHHATGKLQRQARESCNHDPARAAIACQPSVDAGVTARRRSNQQSRGSNPEPAGAAGRQPTLPRKRRSLADAARQSGTVESGNDGMAAPGVSSILEGRYRQGSFGYPLATNTIAGSVLGTAFQPSEQSGRSVGSRIQTADDIGQGCQSSYCSRCVANLPSDLDPGGAVDSRGRQIACLQRGAADQLSDSEQGHSFSVFYERMLESNRLEMPGLEFLRKRTQESRPRGNWLYKYSSHLNPIIRCRMVNFLVYCCRQLPNISPYTLHVAIATMDRFLARSLKRGDAKAREKTLSSLNAVVGTCLLEASKLEDVWQLNIKDIVHAAHYELPDHVLRVWEIRILQTLDFQITVPTILDFLFRFFAEARRLHYHRYGSEGIPSAQLMDERIGNPPVYCSCGRCSGCGVATGIPLNIGDEVLIDSRGQPYHTIVDLLNKTWSPSFSEAKGYTAVESCCIYVAEVFLAHPESIHYSYDLAAAAVMRFVVSVLGRGTDEFALLVPNSIRCLGHDRRLAEEAIITVATVYKEHTVSLQRTTKLRLKLRDDLLKTRESDPDDPILKEALAATTIAEKCRRLAAYLLKSCSRDNQPITVNQARKAAWEFLAQSNCDSLQHAVQKTCRASSSHSTTFRADHYLVKKSNPPINPRPLANQSLGTISNAASSLLGNSSQQSNAQRKSGMFGPITYVVEQEPVESMPALPLGQFAYDITLKHLDAHNLFQLEFELWCEEQGLVSDADGTLTSVTQCSQITASAERPISTAVAASIRRSILCASVAEKAGEEEEEDEEQIADDEAPEFLDENDPPGRRPICVRRETHDSSSASNATVHGRSRVNTDQAVQIFEDILTAQYETGRFEKECSENLGRKDGASSSSFRVNLMTEKRCRGADTSRTSRDASSLALPSFSQRQGLPQFSQADPFIRSGHSSSPAAPRRSKSTGAQPVAGSKPAANITAADNAAKKPGYRRGGGSIPPPAMSPIDFMSIWYGPSGDGAGGEASNDSAQAGPLEESIIPSGGSVAQEIIETCNMEDTGPIAVDTEMRSVSSAPEESSEDERERQDSASIDETEGRTQQRTEVDGVVILDGDSNHSESGNGEASEESDSESSAESDEWTVDGPSGSRHHHQSVDRINLSQFPVCDEATEMFDDGDDLDMLTPTPVKTGPFPGPTVADPVTEKQSRLQRPTADSRSCQKSGPDDSEIRANMTRTRKKAAENTVVCEAGDHRTRNRRNENSTLQKKRQHTNWFDSTIAAVNKGALRKPGSDHDRCTSGSSMDAAVKAIGSNRTRSSRGRGGRSGKNQSRGGDGGEVEVLDSGTEASFRTGVASVTGATERIIPEQDDGDDDHARRVGFAREEQRTYLMKGTHDPNIRPTGRQFDICRPSLKAVVNVAAEMVTAGGNSDVLSHPFLPTQSPEYSYYPSVSGNDHPPLPFPPGAKRKRPSTSGGAPTVSTCCPMTAIYQRSS